MRKLHVFANPNRFMKITDRIFPVSFITMLLLFGLGLYWGLFVAPPDYQQGETARIMYVHVPAAWMSLGIYSFMTAASVSYLIWKHPMAALSARSAAPIGTCFTLICLITGSIWGKPMWGTWWVWDARLTTVLILFFLYLGYSGLIRGFDDPARGEKMASYLNIIGFANIPLIKWSVEWWNTLHQPASIFKKSGPAIHSSMLTPLFLMAAAYLCYFLTVLIVRLRTKVIQRKLWISQIQQGRR